MTSDTPRRFSVGVPMADPPPRRAVESRDPATGEVFAHYASAEADEIRSALLRARAAQLAWAAETPQTRTAVVRRFHSVLSRRSAEVAALISREGGKPLADAIGSDVTVALDFADWVARAAPRFLRSRWARVAGMTMWRKRVRIERRPLGVVAIIAPWNYPFFLPTSYALPALACGNAVIIKPSEFTPGTGAMIEELWCEAGLPDGLLQVVQGDGVTGDLLVRSGVDKVIFTGSVPVGRRVAVACAERFIPCALELGGSDAAIVLADADVLHAADGIVWARFFNAGQTCVAPKRVFVEAAAYDAFIAAATRAVRDLRVGAGSASGSEVGPLIRPEAVRTIAAQRDDAIARGARVAAQAPAPEGDGYFPPTLLTDVDDSMRVMREETFGPLLAVAKVRDADDAIAKANSSPFGLSASVWTRDRARGLDVARRLDTGSVLINDAVAVVGMADIPYGGVKASGHGRLHGAPGFEGCVHSTPVVDDVFSTWRQPWWFAYGPEYAARIDAYRRLAHGHGLIQRLSGVLGTLQLVFSRRGRA